MPVITARTGARSWNTATDWVGDALPVDNVDSAVIPAGCQMLMNTDMAAYTAGILALTVSGDNTTPGMLYWKNGTDGHLKLKTGTSPTGAIIGTTGTFKGRILANSDGVWRGVKGLTVTGNVDNTLTANTHGLADGTLVSFFPNSVTDVLPAPLQVGKSYFVVSTATNTFKVSLTSGGAEIDLTTAGTGTFGVDTCLAIANKAVIELGATSQILATYLDIELVCTNPANLWVRTYKTKYDFTANGTNVSIANNTIDLGTTPPAADLAVMITTVAGTLPAPLIENMVYYVRAVSGNTCKLAYYSGSDLLIVDLTSTGSGTCSIITGHTDTTTKTINVLEDVRADPGWVTTSGHNRVALASTLPANCDQQRDFLATINETNLVFTTNKIDSTQGPGARIGISSRNVSIRSATTTAALNIVDYTSANTAAGVFQCEIANSVATGTTFSGYGIAYGTGHIVSGTVFGCNYGIHYGAGHTISGTVFGCNTGFYSGTGCIITITGTVFGCKTGVYSGTGYIVSGKIGYNSENVAALNVVDFCFGNAEFPGLTVFLRNAKIPANPVFFYINQPGVGSQGKQGVYSEDHGQVIGASCCYQPMGNVLKTAINAGSPAPTTNPAGTTTGHCIEASTIQTNCSTIAPVTIFENHKLWMAAGTYTITYKVQTNYSAIAAGLLKLTCRYPSAASPLAYAESTHSPAITTRANADDWTQTLYVTVVVAVAGWVECKMLLYKYESAKAVFVWPVPVVS